MVVYCLGSLKFVNFNENAGYVNQHLYDTSDCSRVSLIQREWFVGGLRGFMKSFPLAAWFYVGIESVNFACDDVNKVHTNKQTYIRTDTNTHRPSNSVVFDITRLIVLSCIYARFIVRALLRRRE